MTRHLQFAEELRATGEDATAAFAVLQRHAGALGYHATDVASGVITRWPLGSALDWRIDHYQATFDWTADYDGTDFQRYDRAIPHSVRRLTPWFYEETLGRPPEHPVQAAMEANILSRVRSGLAVPLHGPGGRFTAVHLGSLLPQAELERLDRETRPVVHLLAALFVTHVIGSAGGARAPSPLTGRERECLLWAAAGKTAWETSMILAVSESVVRKHLAAAARKLGASTRAQAVAAALARGLLEP